MKRFKKIVSLILVFVMVVSMFGQVALAEGVTLQEGQDTPMARLQAKVDELNAKVADGTLSVGLKNGQFEVSKFDALIKQIKEAEDLITATGTDQAYSDRLVALNGAASQSQQGLEFEVEVSLEDKVLNSAIFDITYMYIQANQNQHVLNFACVDKASGATYIVNKHLSLQAGVNTVTLASDQLVSLNLSTLTHQSSVNFTTDVDGYVSSSGKMLEGQNHLVKVVNQAYKQMVVRQYHQRTENGGKAAIIRVDHPNLSQQTYQFTDLDANNSSILATTIIPNQTSFFDLVNLMDTHGNDFSFYYEYSYPQDSSEGVTIHVLPYHLTFTSTGDGKKYEFDWNFDNKLFAYENMPLQLPNLPAGEYDLDITLKDFNHLDKLAISRRVNVGQAAAPKAAFTGLSYKSDGYFEFTTNAGDFSNASATLMVGGQQKLDLVQNVAGLEGLNEYQQHLIPMDVKVVKLNGQVEESLDTWVDGQLSSFTDDGYRSFYMLNLQPQTQKFEPDSTYRVYLVNTFDKALLNKIIENTLPNPSLIRAEVNSPQEWELVDGTSNIAPLDGPSSLFEIKGKALPYVDLGDLVLNLVAFDRHQEITKLEVVLSSDQALSINNMVLNMGSDLVGVYTSETSPLNYKRFVFNDLTLPTGETQLKFKFNAEHLNDVMHMFSHTGKFTLLGYNASGDLVAYKYLTDIKRDQTEKITDISYDKTNHWLEFSIADANITDQDLLFIGMNGVLHEQFATVNKDLVLTNANALLVDSNDQPVTNVVIQGYTQGVQRPDDLSLDIRVQNKDLSPMGLKANTTYRLKLLTQDAYRHIEAYLDAVSLPQGTTNNLMMTYAKEVPNAGWQRQLDGHATLGALSVPTDLVYKSLPGTGRLYVAGTGMKLLFNNRDEQDTVVKDTGLNEIKKIDLILYSTAAIDQQALNYKVNGGASTGASRVESIENGVNKAVYTLDVAVTDGVLSLDLLGDQIKEFFIKYLYFNSPNLGYQSRLVVLAYDANNQIIGYRMPYWLDQLNIVEPKLSISYDKTYNDNDEAVGHYSLTSVDENTTALSGRVRPYENGTSTLNYSLRADMTGQKLDKLVVVGASQVLGETDKTHFLITLNPYDHHTYQQYIRFGNTKYMAANTFGSQPIADNIVLDVLRGTNDLYSSQVPLLTGKDNQVDLTVYGLADDGSLLALDSHTILYKPRTMEDIFDHAEGFAPSKIKSSSDGPTVRIRDFSGDLSKLTLKLYNNDELVTSYQTATITDTYDHTYPGDTSGMSNKMYLVKFTNPTGAGISNQVNNTWLKGELNYDLNQGLSKAMPGLMIDNEPPRLNTPTYVGVDNNKHVFDLHFGGEVWLSDLTKALEFRSKGQVLTGFSDFELAIDTLNDPVRYPIHKAKLKFNTLPEDLDVRVVNLSDTAGNLLSASPWQPLEARVQWSGFLKQANGDVLKNIELQLMKTSNDFSFDDTNVNLNFKTYHLKTDDMGYFSVGLPFGEYKVLRAWTRVNDSHREYGTLNFGHFSLPLLGSDNPLVMDLVEKPMNLTGWVTKGQGYDLQGVLDLNQVPANEEKAKFEDFRNGIITFDSRSWDDLSKDEQGRIHDKIESYKYMVHLKTDGTFEASLPQGQYRVSGKREFTGDQSWFESLVAPEDFNVVDGQVTSLNELAFQVPNHSISVKLSDGTPMTSGYLGLIVDGQYYHVQVNDLGVGRFYTDKTGQVTVLSASTNNVLTGMNIYHSYSLGELSLNLEEHMTLTLLPNTKVIKLMAGDGQPVSRYDNIYLGLDQNGRHMSAHVNSGSLGVYTSDSQHPLVITQLDYRGKSSNPDITLNDPVTEVDVSQHYKVQVRVVDENGVGLANREVYVHFEALRRGESQLTDDNGYALFSLANINSADAGPSIEISHVKYNGSETYLGLMKNFDVNLDLNKYQVTVAAPNFTGYLESTTDPLFKDGWVNIEKQGNPRKWLHADINRYSGKFELAITEAGTYTLVSAGKNFDRKDYHFEFVAKEEAGKIKLYQRDGLTPLSGDVIIKDTKNFKGTLYKYDNIKYEGDHVNMEVRLFADGAWVSQDKFSKWVEVKADGTFEMYLPPVAGQEYRIARIHTSHFGYDLGSGVPITLDELTPVVVNDYFNITGQVSDYDGTKAFDGQVRFYVLSGGALQTSSESARIDREGYFTKITSANELKLQEVWYRLEGVNDDFSIRYNEHWQDSLSVGSDTKNMTLKPNYQGLVTLDELTSKSAADIKHGGVQIIPVFKEADLSPELWDLYTNDPWRFGVWAQMKFTENNGTVGTFYAALPAGDYLLKYLHIDQGGTDLNIKFSVSGANQSHTFDLGNLFNVKAKLIKGTSPVENAWVHLRPEGNSRVWFNGRTDANGEFKLNLEDGKYTLENYYQQAYFNGSTMVNENQGELKVKLQVVNGIAYYGWTDTSKTFNNTTIKLNVLGSVNTLTGPMNDAWLNFKDTNNNRFWAHTSNKTNTFALILPQGTYTITEVGNQSGFSQINRVFSVLEDGSLESEDAGLVVDGQLVVKPATPNFKGTVYPSAYINQDTPVLAWGRLIVKPAQDGDYKWDRARHIELDKFGKFNTFIADGEWKIVEMASYGYWKRLDIPFTVTGGQVSSGFQGFSANDFKVYPPQANFVASIYGPNGSKLEKHGWLVVKPRQASEHDWTGAKWLENTKLVDGTWRVEGNLSQGEWVIVETGSEGFTYKVDQEFTIAQDQVVLDVIKPQTNFTARVYQTSDQSSPLANGLVKIIRVNDQGKQVKLNGAALDQYDRLDYKTGIAWQQAMFVQTDGQGYMNTRLKTGDYKVVRVQNAVVTYQANLVVNSASDDGGLAITKPGNNVKITLTNIPDQLKVNQAWVVLNKVMDGSKVSTSHVLAVTSRVDDTMVLEGYLPEGSYHIGHIMTTLGEFYLNETLEVVTNLDTTFDLGIKSSEARVSGTIKYADMSAASLITLILKNDQGDLITFKTDAAGQFEVVVDDNTQWRVEGIGSQQGYFSYAGAFDDVVVGDIDALVVDIVLD